MKCVLGSLYEYLNKLDIIGKLQWSRFQICCQPRSSPGSRRLYGLLKDWPRGIAEKPALRDTPGTPTGSLPNLKRLQRTPTPQL